MTIRELVRELVEHDADLEVKVSGSSISGFEVTPEGIELKVEKIIEKEFLPEKIEEEIEEKPVVEEKKESKTMAPKVKAKEEKSSDMKEEKKDAKD